MDQAEGLRELMGKGTGVFFNPELDDAIPKVESRQVYGWKDGKFWVDGVAFDSPPTSEAIPSLTRSATDDLITYRRLWLDLKADLERWKSVGGFDKPENLSVENLSAMWEMMQRREEQR